MGLILAKNGSVTTDVVEIHAAASALAGLSCAAGSTGFSGTRDACRELRGWRKGRTVENTVPWLSRRLRLRGRAAPTVGAGIRGVATTGAVARGNEGANGNGSRDAKPLD